MVRLLIVLFWISLIVGTYVTGNVLGNWVVCLLALFFFVLVGAGIDRTRLLKQRRADAGAKPWRQATQPVVHQDSPAR